MKKLAFILIAFVAATLTAFAQHGGKAEPKRIEFAPGRTSTTLSTKLGPHEENGVCLFGKKGAKGDGHKSVNESF
jgi:hypothetical protein